VGANLIPPAGSKVVFTTTGALPTGITAGTSYYVLNSAPNLLISNANFQVSATLNGSAITLSGTQSGTHTATFTAVAGPG
jgi:hypothetical protein